MSAHVGQLSLLDLSEPACDETDAVTRPRRQAATEHDKVEVAAPSHDEHATAPPSRASAALLTTTETAELLHVHPHTVQRLVERGELCAVHLGAAVRFDPDDVAALTGRLKRYERTSAPTAGDVRRSHGSQVS